MGGASKLWKYISNKINTDIYTWSDNRWSTGNVYLNMGFKLDKELGPDYQYVKISNPNFRISKQIMTKKYLKCKPGQTESDRAYELGFARIWDCGKKRFIYSP